jgi:hypothetical protein
MCSILLSRKFKSSEAAIWTSTRLRLVRQSCHQFIIYQSIVCKKYLQQDNNIMSTVLLYSSDFPLY